MGRVQDKHAAWLAAILAEGRELLIAGGPDALTMQALAARLGVTAGALYRYVSAKEEVVLMLERDLVRTLAGRVKEAVEAVPARGAAPALRRIRAAVTGYLSALAEDPTRLALLQRMLTDRAVHIVGPSRLELLVEVLALLGTVEALFADAAAQATLTPGDPRLRALALFSAVQGALALGKLSRTEPDLIDVSGVVETALEGLLAGFAAGPLPAPRVGYVAAALASAPRASAEGTDESAERARGRRVTGGATARVARAKGKGGEA